MPFKHFKHFLCVYGIVSYFLKDSRFIKFNLGLLKSCLSYRRVLWCYKGVGGAVSADLWGVNGVYFSAKLGDVVQTFASLKSNRNKSSAFNCYTSLISLNQPSISHPYLHYSDLNAKSSAWILYISRPWKRASKLFFDEDQSNSWHFKTSPTKQNYLKSFLRKRSFLC